MRAVFAHTLFIVVFLLAACPQSAQVVAPRVDDQTAKADFKTQSAGVLGEPCAWQAEELQHELPINPESTGRAREYRLAFDGLSREFAVITKASPDALSSPVLSTQVFFQRFSHEGRALGSPVELQPELAPLQTDASWNHSLLGVMRVGEAWVALWSQMAYLRDASGYTYPESGIYARRVPDTAPLGSLRTLVTTQTYLRAHDLQWTGNTLAIATVEGPEATTDLGFGGDSVVRVRRFDADLAPRGTLLTIPDERPDLPLSSLQALRMSGDDERLGVFFSGWRLSDPQQTDGVFALIEGEEIVAVNTEVLAINGSSGDLSLGYGGGRFLACTHHPPTCRLFSASDAKPMGTPITFYAPSVRLPCAVRWLDDRFWVAAWGTALNATFHLLGWVDAVGGQGQQLLPSSSETSFLPSAPRHYLLAGGPDELFWIDDRYFNTNADSGVLMRFTKDCP
ncbi:MAG: hypothetical protein JRH20_23580 [Deltaproteobacteria bacterium]|nr:hypothetical protein [Deltaproteobacteria bacterium]